MNAIIPRTIAGEILPPGATIRVVGRAHPLAGRRVERELPAGLSIAEILEECAGNYSGGFVVYLGDHPVLPENYRRVRVKRGVTVTFFPRLQGGDATVWRAVLSAVIAVAALVVAPYLAPELVAGFAAVGITVSTSTAIALAAGGVILAGTLALNALFPIRPPAAQAGAGALNSIQGAQNQANPFGAIPVVLGRSRQSPYYAGKPYTEISGDDQFLRLVFCLGYGPLQIDTLQLGETPLANYSDVALEIRQGFAGDAALTLFPGEVDEQQLAVTLLNNSSVGGVDPPGVNGVGGPWSDSVNTAVDTDEISVDFTAPQGINATDSQGHDISWNVTAQMRYRVLGSSGGWTGPLQAVLAKDYNPTRAGILVGVARGQYEVQTRKLTGDGVAQFTRDTTVWSALRSIKQATPFGFPLPLALIAMRIRATDQLSGTIDTFNCITTSLVLAYSGAGNVWNANTASQNPADLFRWVLQGPANARPVADAGIDIGNLQDWWTSCVANGFKFNQVVQQAGSVYDKLCDIAAAGRAVPTFIDGKWGVIWDRPDDPIVQHFTPRNSWGFKGQRSYAQQPDGWRISFINETNGFTQDEIRVYDDGFDAANATLFEAIQFPGVTDPVLNWKHGRFQIAQARLRPEKISLSTGWENLICTRGDRVKVTHPVLLIGLASGRVKSVAGQVVTVDEQVTIEDGKIYGVTFRVADDSRSVTCAVDPSMVAGDYTALTLVGDLSLLDPDGGDVFAFGETDLESAIYRVQGIAQQASLVAILTLVDDAPAISQADQGPIPAYNPNITIPPDPFTLPPRDLVALEVIEGQGATATAVVRLSWQLPRLGKVASFTVQNRDDDVAGVWRTVDSVPVPRMSTDVPLTAAGTWSFRVQCVFDDNTVSAWAQLLGINLPGLSFAPGDLTNLHEHTVDGQTVLDWTIVSDPRLLFYEIRKGTSWDTGLVVGQDLAQPPWPTTGDGTYHVKAYVLSPFGARIYSADDAAIEIADSIISRNIILSKDEQATGWTGGFDGGVIDGSFIRTDVGHAIGVPWSEEVVSQLGLSGLHIAVYLSTSIVDIGQSNECRFWTLFEADGITIGDDFLSVPDVLGSGDVLGAAATRFIQAFPIWRFAAAGNVDVFAPSDVFTPTDVFTADIHWGEWTAIASGTRVSRFFQPGYVLITNDANTNATGTKFQWFVDVPDREDDYTDLNVGTGGLAVTFYQGGYDGAPPGGGVLPLKFNGGPNGSTVPHVTPAIINPTAGDQVVVTALTAAGCTVTVLNAGVAVARPNVNLLVRGY